MLHRCNVVCVTLVWVKLQLMAMNKVTSEDVSMFLTAALVGLQKHGQHESVQPALLTLALRVYELAVSFIAVSLLSLLAVHIHYYV